MGRLLFGVFWIPNMEECYEFPDELHEYFGQNPPGASEALFSLAKLWFCGVLSELKTIPSKLLVCKFDSERKYATPEGKEIFLGMMVWEEESA